MSDFVFGILFFGTLSQMAQEYKYSTPVKLIKIGQNAIAVDLSANFPDAKVAGGQPAHMTVLFNKDGFIKGAFQHAEKLVEQWKTEKKVKTVGFNLERFGKKSDAIKGPLEELCLYVRTEMGFVGADQRKPHVELRF